MYKNYDKKNSRDSTEIYFGDFFCLHHTDLMVGKPYAEESGSLMNDLIEHTPHDGAGWE